MDFLQDVKDSFVGTLWNADSLTALLAVFPAQGFPTDGYPVIFNGSMNEMAPVYPCLTYRISSSSSESAFRVPLTAELGIPGVDTRPTIETARLEMEIWDNHNHRRTIYAIAEQIDLLLDGRAFDCEFCRIFRFDRVVCQLDLYDRDLNARYALLAYQLRIARTA